ncbi:hypothetical protein PpBr36_01634 [Pyricularia pennisetigena]|uniref:hypothetical protein n=1 Tax=Pyricularia pennisetigena TaxID=1578925 RepID=UPI00114F8BE4|nr:hypothetical protein PpBr36_01634 [Pyricularia pennisetigena]TLS29017.1 hypothetical protein PpBr36_01634 [Pyricularia pennisetigena]
MAWLASLLNSAISPNTAALAWLCYDVVRPSPTNVSVFAGWILWKNQNAVFGLLGVPNPTISTWLSALVGAGFGLLQLRFWTWLLRPPPTIIPAPCEWPGKPLLVPSRTTHSRLFPEKHSFSYSYLLVGIPVGWTGTAGSLVSADTPSRRGWYDVDAADYLARGRGYLGLRGKLDEYLQSQGVEPELYPFAYLVTAAKFLGYHFNPVSFWYLYDSNKVFAAMILEVNNTFGERRMYFLLPSEPKAISDIDANGAAKPDATAEASTQEPTRFTQTWPKDFHVSPFNSRKGSYSVSAKDFLGPNMQGPGTIDVSIVLKSSKGHGKLVARIFSEGNTIDPVSLGAWQRLDFLARWWWVGFVTFPRIVKEAGRLFFQRKLHVWYRPEPLKDSMGRMADETERRLEAVFRFYLKFHVVAKADSALAVRYYASGTEDGAGDLMVSDVARRQGHWGDGEITIKVLTPAFYSRFVGYAHDLEAFFCELRDSETIWVSKPELLPKLALKTPSPTLQASSLMDFVSFRVIQILRRRPERIERPLTSSQTTDTNNGQTKSGDLRGFRISPMDAYVLSSEDAITKESYRSTVLRLFLADRMAFGIMPLYDSLLFTLRAVFAGVLAFSVDKMLSRVI